MLNKDFLSKLGLALNDLQIKTLQDYAELVLLKNKEFNLTAAATFQEVFDRHICDGLQSASVLKQKGLDKQTGADFGTGAGFIGVSIAVALPETTVYLVDSLQKRINFLQWVIYKLGLKNLKVLNSKIGKEQLPLQFDFVTERAMGEIDDILPLCLNALKEKGAFFALLSKNTKSTTPPAEELFYSLPGDKDILSRKISVYYGHN